VSLKETLAAAIQQDLDMIKTHLNDFTDAEWMTRPVPAANHAAWQMAHLANFDVMVAGVLAPGAKVSKPASLDQCQGAEAAKSDDPKKFPTKAEVLKVMDEANAIQVAAIKNMSDADFDKPSPEQFRQWAPTVGHLVLLLPAHASMHLGQIQVIRRKLGRPVMF
jgi:roadblock/LC7 domain-containing protein